MLGSSPGSGAGTAWDAPSVTPMQLTRLVRRSGKAVWLLVLVPVLAVAASTAVTMRTEPSDRLLATVSVFSPAGTAPAATVTQAVDGFKSTVVSDGVVQVAAEEAGVELSELGGRLTVQHPAAVFAPCDGARLREGLQRGRNGRALSADQPAQNLMRQGHIDDDAVLRDAPEPIRKVPEHQEQPDVDAGDGVDCEPRGEPL